MGEPAFMCLCAEPGSGPSERGEHRPFEWGRCVWGGLSSALGVVRCGRSAGCVLCVLWAIHIGCCVGGEYPVGVSILSSGVGEVLLPTTLTTATKPLSLVVA